MLIIFKYRLRLFTEKKEEFYHEPHVAGRAAQAKTFAH